MSAIRKQSPGVVIVNEAFARKFFPNEDPIGKHIKPGISTDDDEPMMREIVGVVADVRNRNLNSDLRPGYFVPQSQMPFDQMTMVVKTTSDPHSLINAIQNEVQAMDQRGAGLQRQDDGRIHFCVGGGAAVQCDTADDLRRRGFGPDDCWACTA